MRRFISLYELPLELLNQEDQMMKCNTSGVMEHSSTLQGAMSHAHESKSCLGDQVVYSVQLSSILWSSWPMHPSSFSCAPSFVNLGMRFLLRGEGCNTPCYAFHNYLHYKLNQASSALVNQVVEVWNQNSKSRVQIWSLKFCLVWTDYLS
jgi:hypothetical protein